MLERVVKILLVDDEPDILDGLADILASKGAHTATAPSAIAAIQRLANERYDLIVTDLNMPQVNGMELVTWIKSNIWNSRSKIVVSSGYFDKQIRKKLVDEFNVTTFDKMELMTKLVDLVAEMREQKNKDPLVIGRPQRDEIVAKTIADATRKILDATSPGHLMSFAHATDLDWDSLSPVAMTVFFGPYCRGEVHLRLNERFVRETMKNAGATAETPVSLADFEDFAKELCRQVSSEIGRRMAEIQAQERITLGRTLLYYPDPYNPVNPTGNSLASIRFAHKSGSLADIIFGFHLG